MLPSRGADVPDPSGVGHATLRRPRRDAALVVRPPEPRVGQLTGGTFAQLGEIRTSELLKELEGVLRR